MPHVIANAVEDTTATTSTGSYTADGSPPSGAQSFTAALADGDTCVYQVDDLSIGGTDVEVGLGTWTESGSVLARTTIFYSTNADAAVSWGAGTKKLRMVLAADRYCDSADGIGIASLTNGAIPVYNSTTGYLEDNGSSLITDLFESTRTSQNGSGISDALVARTDGKTAGDGSQIRFNFLDDGDSVTDYGQVGVEIVDPTNTSEDGAFFVDVVAAGSLSERFRVTDAEARVVSADLRVDENTVLGDTSQNPKTISSWTSGTAHAYLNLYEATNDAYLAIQGTTGAYLALVDLGGAANDKWIMWGVDSGKFNLHSYNDAGTKNVSNIMSIDIGTGNVAIGEAQAGTAKLYVSGGRFQIENNQTILFETVVAGTAGTIYADTNDDILHTVNGVTMITLDEDNTEIEIGGCVHFGTNTATVSMNAVTLDLGDSNHFELDLAAATGTVTLTLTEPEGQTSGMILIKMDSTPRDITWASTGTATFKWPDGAKTWSDYTANYYIPVSWHYAPDADHLIMVPLPEYA